MMNVFKGCFPDLDAAASAIIERVCDTPFPGVSKIEIYSHFLYTLEMTTTVRRFVLYCVAEAVPETDPHSPVKMCLIIQAEVWPNAVEYMLSDETNAHFCADAPPHILSQLDDPINAASHVWRQRCKSNLPWNYTLVVSPLPEGRFEIAVYAERGSTTHLAFRISLRASDVDHIIAGLLHDFPGMTGDIPHHLRQRDPVSLAL